MSSLIVRLVVWVAALLVAALGPAFAEKRVALVVGNAAYGKVDRLENPPNDVADVSAALIRLGFEVTRLENAGYEFMRRGLRDFGRLSFGADMAVVYYAGHGVEMAGENWLIPTDAELRRDIDIEHEAIPLKSVTATVEGARKLGLVILDACRNNPFAAQMQKTGGANRAIGRGLARVEPSGSVLVAFAAKEGTTALDGKTRNSPYAAALLKHIETPGLEINFLFRNVRDDVVATTSRAQEPWLYGSLSKESIFLKEAPAAPTQPPAPGRPAIVLPAQPAAPLFAGDPGVACDKLAASKFDSRRPSTVPPVQESQIDAPRAIAACTAAVAVYPKEARYVFQLAVAHAVARNVDPLIANFGKAAKMGYGAAACTAGLILASGRITTAHMPFAIRWFEIGAELGEPACFNNLGLAYLNGSGVEKNIPKAAVFFRRAADVGEEKSMVTIGLLLETGTGVTKDLVAARAYYEKAVALGNFTAMNNLALHLTRNEPRDFARAGDLLLTAIKGGSEVVRANLTEKWSEVLVPELRTAIERRLAARGFLKRAPGTNFDQATMQALQQFIVAP